MLEKEMYGVVHWWWNVSHGGCAYSGVKTSTLDRKGC